MKYTSEIVIDLPRERVISLFDDPDNLGKWQPELLSFEHVSGTPGQPGARSKLLYQMGKRQIEMIETVVVRNLPHEFTGTYDAKGVHNMVRNRFEKIGENTTKWTAEQEFQFSGMMKLMGWLMPGAFKKQSMLHMERFKNFAEAVAPRATQEEE